MNCICYYMFIESPEKVSASPNQNVSCRFTQQQPEGQRLAGASQSDTGGASTKSRCLVSHHISLPPGWLPYPPTPPFHPFLHSPGSSLPPSPEGVRKVGRIFALPGATGSLCHPLTQTAGSALHTRIIRR